MKTKVALIFGGRSLESDISVITAVQTYAHLDERLYDVEPVYLFDGDFYMDKMSTLKAFTPFIVTEHTKVLLYTGGFYTTTKKGIKAHFKPDVALICCHGGEGENGILQALMQYYRIPHTSAGVLQSAVCMDKVVSKELFENMLLNVVANLVVMREEYESDSEKTLFHLESFLTYPLIVKPASLGSSIGIHTASCYQELKDALDIACEFDEKIIVEQKLTDFKEVNCAAFRDGDKIVVSETEQPLSTHDFLTFEEKYSTGKMSGGGHVIPAEIGSLNSVVKANTERIYRELDLNGVVRVDYLVDLNRNKVYINEINTIPGSLAFYLFEKVGISFAAMLGKIITAAINRAEKLKQRTTNFKTGVLENYHGGGKL